MSLFARVSLRFSRKYMQSPVATVVRATSLVCARSPVPTGLRAASFSTGSSDGSDDQPESHPDFMSQSNLEGGDEAVGTYIDGLVKENPVFLFMKGTPEQPQCGFSYQVVRILHAQGVEFQSLNVLENQSVREGIKEYSDWPTIPQLYIDGEFVGGCDIVTSMHQDGSLEEMLEEKR